MGMLRRFFEDKEGHIAIIDWPNAPLIVWLLSSLVGKISSGNVGSAAAFIGTTAIFIWASLEIIWGRSMFRRVLGAGIFGIVLWRFFT